MSYSLSSTTKALTTFTTLVNKCTMSSLYPDASQTGLNSAGLKPEVTKTLLERSAQPHEQTILSALREVGSHFQVSSYTSPDTLSYTLANQPTYADILCQLGALLTNSPRPLSIFTPKMLSSMTQLASPRGLAQFTTNLLGWQR